MTNHKKRLVLLDAHAIIHRAYHALPDFSNTQGEPTGALFGIATMLMKIIDELQPDYVIACFDLPQKTFRHDAYDGYKGTRSKTDDALVAQLSRARDMFHAFSIPIYDAPGFEADDVLGTIIEQFRNDDSTEIIIASGDMDTLQLVSDKVQVFTLKKGIQDTVLYDTDSVYARFGFGPELLPDYKGLRGDPSDNIPGIAGIGEKTATALVKQFGTIESLYKTLEKDRNTLLQAGFSERIVKLVEQGHEDALFSKTLATIRRDAPITCVLPEKTFKESLSYEQVEQLFRELEFRSLINRLQQFTGQSKTESPGRAVPQESYSEQEVLETAIALWLLHSEKTHADIEEILAYAKTQSFAQARTVIFSELEHSGMKHVYHEIEQPIISHIQKMTEYGVMIDRTHFEKLSHSFHATLDRLTETIYGLAGRSFNINSPKQLGEILFDELRLPVQGKKRSTNIEVLEKLKEHHAIIDVIMQYRELQKLTSTYIDVLPDLADVHHRIHATYFQHGTTTGRFASVQPNMQNIPIKGEFGTDIRNGFIAGPDHVLVACDYSQIELRVVAMLSGDEKLTDIFKQGKDVHASVASYVFSVPESQVTKDMRRQAKVINFGILYGMGVLSLKKNLGSTKEEAQRFYDAYFEQFEGIKNYFDTVKENAYKTKTTQTLFGRIREFPALSSRIPYIRAMAERTVINAPIQGTSADIIKLAIRYVYEDLEHAGIATHVHLIMQIHDELVFEIHKDYSAQAIPIIQHAMQTVLSRSFINYQTEIPLLVSTATGNRWGELE